VIGRKNFSTQRNKKGNVGWGLLKAIYSRKNPESHRDFDRSKIKPFFTLSWG
jgi:hypothetical protein